ncbi:MAG TPA: hypothetical protein VK939_07900 [Longimicrobiales bacterium]|nr:hypothetical protein [Longimicrobiales bacterium]
MGPGGADAVLPTGRPGILELRNPRLAFFFVGPFYPAWLRLWREALILAAALWTLAHGTVVVTRAIAGSPARLGWKPLADGTVEHHSPVYGV